MEAVARFLIHRFNARLISRFDAKSKLHSLALLPSTHGLTPVARLTDVLWAVLHWSWEGPILSYTRCRPVESPVGSAEGGASTRLGMPSPAQKDSQPPPIAR